MTGLGRSTIYELIASGDIEAAKVGRATVILVESIRSFLMANRKAPRPLASTPPLDQKMALTKSAHRVPKTSRRKEIETGAIFRRGR